eukprot:2020266-Pyramimonas_sp.AAC.2
MPFLLGLYALGIGGASSAETTIPAREWMSPLLPVYHIAMGTICTSKHSDACPPRVRILRRNDLTGDSMAATFNTTCPPRLGTKARLRLEQ